MADVKCILRRNVWNLSLCNVTILIYSCTPATVLFCVRYVCCVHAVCESVCPQCPVCLCRNLFHAFINPPSRLSQSSRVNDHLGLVSVGYPYNYGQLHYVIYIDTETPPGGDEECRQGEEDSKESIHLWHRYC